MKNEDPYVDPTRGVLRNKLGLTDAAALDVHERRLVSQRIVEGAPGGHFDLCTCSCSLGRRDIGWISRN